MKEGTTLADLLRRRRLGDVHRLVLSGSRPAAGRRRILHDVGTEGSLGDAERIRPESGCLGDRLDRHEPVGGDASAKRRSPQGGSNKPSIVRRQRVVALWSTSASTTRLKPSWLHWCCEMVYATLEA